MRIAVFSDVQANIQAFEVVAEDIDRWDPDLVIMAGDLVNRGPSNAECLSLFVDRATQKGWLPIVGNHEEWVLRCFDEPPANPLEAEMRRFTDWAAAQIGAADGEVMRDWPDHLLLQGTGDAWVHVTHGSMAGNRAGVSQSLSDDQLRERLPENVSLFIGGHTHKVHQRRFGDTDVVNVGSVGSPFDLDERASYGRFELRDGRWHTHILRLPYDRAATERDFHDSGFLDEGGPLARIIFEEWKCADMRIRYWAERYQAAVLAGDIGLAESVDAFFADMK